MYLFIYVNDCYLNVFYDTVQDVIFILNCWVGIYFFTTILNIYRWWIFKLLYLVEIK